MTKRRELTLNKLHSLSKEEQNEGIKALVKCIKKKLRIGSRFDKTLRGAYSYSNLNDEALSYYLNKTIEALYNPEQGWDWKFEERTFAEQLVRIAEKFMSDEPKRYKLKMEKEPPPIIIDDDISNIIEQFDKLDEDSNEKEEISNRIIKLAEECSIEDTNLNYFVIRYFENASIETIASEMSITKEDVYVLRKKILRKLKSRISEIQD